MSFQLFGGIFITFYVILLLLTFLLDHDMNNYLGQQSLVVGSLVLLMHETGLKRSISKIQTNKRNLSLD